VGKGRLRPAQTLLYFNTVYGYGVMLLVQRGGNPNVINWLWMEVSNTALFIG
jgi:hypothetical protein